MSATSRGLLWWKKQVKDEPRKERDYDREIDFINSKLDSLDKRVRIMEQNARDDSDN